MGFGALIWGRRDLLRRVNPRPSMAAGRERERGWMCSYGSMQSLKIKIQIKITRSL